MQKSSISDDPHGFSIENIHGIDNLNDLHLSQLNNQLRYELRNLNTDVDVGIHISDDDEDDDEEEFDEDGNIISSKGSLRSKIHTDSNIIEQTLNSAFPDSESEPFKNYIKSIVDRGHNEINNGHNHTTSTIQAYLHLKNLNEEENKLDGYQIEVHDENIENKNDNIKNINNNNEDTNNHNSNTIDTSSSIGRSTATKPSNININNKKNSNSNVLRRKLNLVNVKGEIPIAPKEGGLKRMKIGNFNINQNKNHIGNIDKNGNMRENIYGSGLEGDMDNDKRMNGNGVNNNNNNSNNNSGNEQGSGLSLNIKKCSRCRMKRIHETTEELEKYQTCMQCRERRKVRDRKPRVLVKLPNLSDDWKTYLGKVELNTVIDLYQHNYRAYTDENEFPRYRADELTLPIVQSIGERIVEKYIHPLQEVTGFKFAVRDHHNPPLYDQNRAKKITWMFICSQDKFRRRKSRSENKRQVSNRLKTEECCSKITLSYDVVYGIVQISYNHKHHKPLKSLNVSSGIGNKSNNISIVNGEDSQVETNDSFDVSENAYITGGGGDDNNDRDNDDENIEGCEEDESGGVKGIGVEGEDGGQDKKYHASREVIEAAAAAVAAVAAAGGDHVDGVDVENVENVEDVEVDKGQREGHPEDKVFDNEQFENINMSMMDVDEGVTGVGDVDLDVDVDDVAEIAKLLKQVQQAQSRRLCYGDELEN